jgi:hypothetical protein
MEITDSFIQALNVKKKWLKHEVIVIEDNLYRAFRLQSAYKKICKRGGGATLTSIVKDGHVIVMNYRTRHGQGSVRLI